MSDDCRGDFDVGDLRVSFFRYGIVSFAFCCSPKVAKA